MMAEEPRYTIEQIELLRRLLRTGLSRDHIIYAIDSMSRFDREFGDYSSHPKTEQVQLHSTVRGVDAQSPIQQQSPQSSSVDKLEPVSPSRILSETEATTAYQFLQGTQSTTSTGQDGVTKHDVTHNYDDVTRTPLKVDEYQVSEEEIQEMMSKGLPVVKSMLREFLLNNNLSQNQLGRDIGVTGSYISQYFHSVRSMRNGTIMRMCRWYIGKKRELEAIRGGEGGASSSTSQYTSPAKYDPFIQSPTSRLSPYNHADLGKNFKVRRERFVWKEGCTKVLEAYFKKNPYPNELERMRLSETCNGMQRMSGQAIPDSGIVTQERVYHWFANRRKEINKRKKLTEVNPVGMSQEGEGAIQMGEENVTENHPTIQMPGLSGDQLDDSGDPANDVSDHVMDLDDDHPRDPKQIADELQEVNNSIITFMKAVEDKSDDTKPEVVLSE